ncbi:hypothetical protein [Chryseobacterium indoltheticum]|uniref:hypothetical protein n=1 Tax=Chryseobacterium indoltheticum TaxID=254 RepID=UPI003F4911B9
MMKERDQLADIDFVKVDYTSYLQKNKIKVTTEDLANYIKAHPVQFKTEPSRNLGIVFFLLSQVRRMKLQYRKILPKYFLEVQMQVVEKRKFPEHYK